MRVSEWVRINEWVRRKSWKIFESDVKRCEIFAIACLDRNKWLYDQDKRARLFLHLKFFDEEC